ncbi:hypothetical protein HBI81_230170 [Parastagonospora nodorum]|nr:hypothetical protein HBI18_251520 [Parastagonospora nodorum]KAH6512318.1 hypothetical protein HBI81_230170 [Parastagonospora nodorum]
MASSSNNAFMQSSNVDFPYPAFLGDYPFDSGLNQYDAVQQAPPPAKSIAPNGLRSDVMPGNNLHFLECMEKIARNLSGLESTFSSRQQEEKARDDALAQVSRKQNWLHRGAEEDRKVLEKIQNLLAEVQAQITEAQRQAAEMQQMFVRLDSKFDETLARVELNSKQSDAARSKLLEQLCEIITQNAVQR